ncbi:MAG: PTS system mannose/fructose/sorbose family transporter subunit IID [Endomicrobium sp.]|jgi:PTS system mannose-specific IID component|nr:PTS system mannose/fructose/sorbose family transporter subunit IID [Endomicrobium sp.]
MIKLYSRIFIRSFFLQSLWNYERIQNIGFVFILRPFFDILYSVEKEKKEALLRHVGYFNTQPYMVGMIVGIIANMEKEIAKLEPANRGEIIRDMKRVKSNMSGPLAAIGEPFFYGDLRTMLSFLTIFIMVILSTNLEKYIILAPIVFILLYNFLHLGTRISLLYEGFKYCGNNMKTLVHFNSLSETIRLGVFIMFLATFSLYLAVFGFSNEGRLFNSGYIDLFVYIVVFLFSVFCNK